jgi:hypothetical protein
MDDIAAARRDGKDRVEAEVGDGTFIPLLFFQFGHVISYYLKIFQVDDQGLTDGLSTSPRHPIHRPNSTSDRR